MSLFRKSLFAVTLMFAYGLAGANHLCFAKNDATIPKGEKYIQASKLSLAAGQAWNLNQSSLIMGEYDVLVNKEGIKATCSRSGLTFVAKAPEWKPLGYSQRAKALWQPKSNEEFNPSAGPCKVLAIGGIPALSSIPLVHQGTKTIQGLVCENFVTSEEWTKRQGDLVKQDRVNSRSARKAQFQAAELNLPKPSYTILEQIYGLPRYPLAPIFYNYVSFQHAVKPVLVTNNIKVSKVPKDWLAIPKGLHIVRDAQDLNLDQTAQSGMENLFGAEP